MIPSSYLPFFGACASAGAALVGLLFVAVSVAPDRILTDRAPIEVQAVAMSTFTALVDAFFVSLLALVPTSSLGPAAATAGALALFNSGVVAVRLARSRQSWRGILRRGAFVAASAVVYGAQTYQGFVLTRDTHDNSAVSTLAFIVVTVYAIGLYRAWQLLGGRRYGVGGWLNILHDISQIHGDRPHAATHSGAQEAPLPADIHAGTGLEKS